MPVRVRRYAGRLVVTGSAGESQVPVRRLRRGARVGTSLILHRDDTPDWHLAVHDVDDGSWLMALKPRHARASRLPRIAGLSAGALALIAVAAWTGREDLIEAAAPLLPHDVTEPMGCSYVAEAGAACTAGAGRAALERLTARIAAAAPPSEPLTVTVVDTAEVNAVALPGGHVAIYRGLLDQAQSADEVAGALAHEIAHVARQHPNQALLREMGPAVLARILGSDAGSDAGLTLLTQGSVAAEAEADGGAIATMRRARISPEAIAKYFERQAAVSGGGDYETTHPSDASRAARYRAAAAAGGAEPAMPESDWQALRTICG